MTELHGSLHRVTCLSCWSRSAREELDARLRAANPAWTAAVLGLDPAVQPDGDVALEETGGFTVADCLACGGLLKPDVVFFGENVPKARVEACYALVSASSALVVLGSSLTVMSGLRYVRHASSLGIPVVIVNQGATRGDELAAARLDAPLGAVLSGLVRELGLPVGSAALEGDVRLGPGDRGAQLTQEDAGAAGGVADRGGGHRQGGHRVAGAVAQAHADGADAGL